MIKINHIPATSALGNPSIQFRLNGVCVAVFYEWGNCEGEKWAFHLTLIHPLIGYSIDENGGQATDISRLISVMNVVLESKGEQTVNFLERETLIPAIVEALKPAYLNAPAHSASDDYYGE